MGSYLNSESFRERELSPAAAGSLSKAFNIQPSVM